MALFLGALEYVLEDGPRYDWFEDPTIALAAVVSASSAVIFFMRVLIARQPIVDLRSFADRNFALGSMFSFVLGIGLYGLTYLYPVFLGGYPRLQCAVGRQDHVRVRRYDVRLRPDRWQADGQDRSPPDAGGRFHHRRNQQLAGDLYHQQLGFLGAVLPASAARLRHDVCHRADYQHLADTISGHAKKRLRAVQPHAQSRRRGWSRRAEHGARQAHRSAFGAPPSIPSPGRDSRSWRR